MANLVLQNLVAELTFDPARAGDNEMHMVFGDCVVRVSDGDRELGAIAACVGGGIELRDKTSGRTWTIGSRALWAAFQAALAAE